jgi:type IX secretion system PorP/SprF family membrane protein
MIFKKTALRRLLTYILPLLISVRAYAQDPQFSQFYANPFNTNPAFAGSSTVGRLVLNTRNQWPGISGSFTTANASYDEHFEAINGGIGIQAHFDEQGTGTLRTVGANMAYSYLIPVSRKFTIRLALQAGFMQKSVDFTKFLWRSQLGTNGFSKDAPAEPLGTPEGKANIINFAAGFLGYSKNFYFGFAAHNLTQPDQSFNLNNKAIVAPIYRRFTGHVGFIYPINESRIKSRSSYLYPNVIYMQQFFNGQQAAQLNLGMYVSKGSLVGGLYMRQTNANTDAIIAIVGISRKS